MLILSMLNKCMSSHWLRCQWLIVCPVRAYLKSQGSWRPFTKSLECHWKFCWPSSVFLFPIAVNLCWQLRSLEVSKPPGCVFTNVISWFSATWETTHSVVNFVIMYLLWSKRTTNKWKSDLYLCFSCYFSEGKEILCSINNMSLHQDLIYSRRSIERGRRGPKDSTALRSTRG